MAEEQTPASGGQTQAAPQKPAGQPSQRAIIALILGIVGFFFFQPLGIVAWVMGQRERNAIARGESPKEGMGLATAGWILGIIDTVLFVLIIIGIIIFIIILIIAASSGTTTNSFSY